MEKSVLSYIFFALLSVNLLMFGFYNFISKPSERISDTVKTAQSQLKSPVTFTNVTSEVPPLIGTKK